MILQVIRIKIALRNIIRHKLRSILSISMISSAIIAIVLFQGFTQFSLDVMTEIASENQFGHMQIGKKSYWAPKEEARQDKMFELKELDTLVSKNTSIKSISGRLAFFGLVSNGNQSIGAKVIGIDTIKENNFKNSMKIMSGKFFESSDSHQIMIGNLLAKQMNIQPNQSITVLTSTIDGVINAMDLEVSGIFSAGLDEIDAQVAYIPLTTSQKILDTTTVDVAVTRFDDQTLAQEENRNIQTILDDSKLELKSKPWRELAVLFRQVENFYDVQNKIVESILLALMFLGILNTISMTVIERTGEIGTLRSLGETRFDIVKQFVIESTLISIIGIVFGVILSYLLIQVIHFVEIVTDMPGASTPFVIKILYLPSSLIYASTLSFITTLIATCIPAFRVSKTDIVEALRKNI